MFQIFMNITWLTIAETLNSTLVVFTTMQIIYAIDSLFYESDLTTTFEFMHEGIGCQVCYGYFIYPFMPTLITKHILDESVELQNWTLFASSLLYSTGYYIYRASNSQKGMLRRNPSDPRITRELICAIVSGFVRFWSRFKNFISGKFVIALPL